MENYLPFFAKHWHTVATVGASLLVGAVIQRSLQAEEKNKSIVTQFPLSKSAPSIRERVVQQQRRESADEVVDEEDIVQDDDAEEEEALQIPFHHVRLSEDDCIHKSAQFYGKMNLRRSVRSISKDAVPLQVIENIIKTGG
jgi:hypothetical protein